MNGTIYKTHKETLVISSNTRIILYFCKIRTNNLNYSILMSGVRKKKVEDLLIGLVDADLLDNGTRHPNLALLKIAGFLKDNNIPHELILDGDADISKYDRIFISKVFTFTKMPAFYEKVNEFVWHTKITVGGTGFYADEVNVKMFTGKRVEDMSRLEKDSFLNLFPNQRGGVRERGIDMARQMPEYDLYAPFIEKQIQQGSKREKYKDYEKYSIGFLTRGCIRHCAFCINKLEKRVQRYSDLEWFLDESKDDRGHLKRPYIYLWDDNFLASDKTIWKPLLQKLIDSGRPFQFRQGLDERMLAQSPDGEEMAEMLSKAKYHGDFIFAFDNWRDREVIEKALKIWKRFNPKKGTKFYLFCGFKQTPEGREKFYKDIWELFQRIRILMRYGCVGYVMRHQDYHQAPIANIYIQIARWCNQQQFYKKMSFWEFCYRNQSYWEEHCLQDSSRPKLMTFEEFELDVKNGYYKNVKMCLPLRDIVDILEMFPEHRSKLIEMFNFKMSSLLDPTLWKKP